MEESRENPRKFQIKSCFSEKRNRAELAAFQRVRRGLVYLSGESRPSLALPLHSGVTMTVYLSGESRPSLASADPDPDAIAVYLSGESRPSLA